MRRLRKLLAFVAVAAALVALGSSLLRRLPPPVHAPLAPPAARGPQRLDHAELLRDVETLAAPAYDGRKTGTPGNHLAQKFIQERFRTLGLAPLAPLTDFAEPFSFTQHSVRGLLSAGGHFLVPFPDATNLVATIPGKDPGARPLLLSAHYDHLGERGGKLFPGADDNASGVATLLAIARYLEAHPPRHPVVLAAFDGEEEGLRGSQAFVADPRMPTTRLALAVNLDMVSHSENNELFVAGASEHPQLATVVAQAQPKVEVNLLLGHDQPFWREPREENWTDSSDQGPFHARGIPTLYFGVEDHPDYHRPTDTFESITPAFFVGAAEAIAEVVVELDAMPEPLVE